MALGPRLDLRQSQSLVMTPQLQQAIRLLALSNIEVEAYIAGELERNPLLEIGREAAGDAPGGDVGAGERDGAGEGGGEDVSPAPGGAEASSDTMMRDDAVGGDNPLDIDAAADGPDRDGGSAAHEGGGPASLEGTTGGFSEDGPDFERFASGGVGLHEHLMEQARLRLSGQGPPIAGHPRRQIDAAG